MIKTRERDAGLGELSWSRLLGVASTIVQMAEANTLGGYPKIATVIGADLWRLAQMRAGQTIRFNIVDNDIAVNALRENRNEQNDLRMELAAVGAASKRID
jgi:allophanate hydrolase subunit 2